MKCPECGQWNRASMPHCTRCGTPLNIDASSRVAWKDTLRDGGASTAYLRADEFGMVDDTPDSRDTLAREMQDLKARKKRGAELKKQLRGETGSHQPSRAPYDEKAAFVSSPDKKPDQPAPAGSSPSDIKMRRESAVRHHVRFMDEASTFIEPRSYDPLLPEYPGAGRSRSVTYTSAFSPYRSRDGRVIFRRVAAVILALVLLGGGGWFAWKYFLSGRQPHYNTSAIVTSTMANDLAEHTILIPGEEGTSIYIRELHASYVVIDGYATVEIPDHIWYDNMEGTLGETMDVTLTPFLKNSSGRQTPLDLISYTIAIPLSPLSLDTPNTLRTTVSTTMANIVLNVRPGARVTVNGKDYSDTVNDEGELSINVKVQPNGDNYYEIVTRAQYCRENSITLVLYRAKQEIPLDLAPETATSTYNQDITVNGSTVPGAYVRVLTSHSDLDISKIESTGDFSFIAHFDHIGDNTISIVASMNGKTTQVDHVVYYVPIADIYTTKAFTLNESDYSELLANIDARSEKGQIYRVTGYIQYFISEKPQIAVINTSEDGKSRPVRVENKSKTKWVQGNYYRLYADVYGSYSNMPAMYARYTYDK